MAKDRVDCAVVIALREEFQGQGTIHGFEDYFELAPDSKAGPFQSFQFSDSTGFARTGVVSVMESMSPLSAYEASRDLLDMFEPSLLVNIGISGALATELRIGDVVIADEIDAYDYRAKAVPSGISSGDFTFYWGGKHFSPSPDVAEALRRIWQSQALYQQWRTECTNRLINGLGPELATRLSGAGLIANEQRVHHGTIASGNIVGASSAFRKSLIASHDRTLLSMEMESFGCLRASKRSSCRTLILKAISDLADEKKEELERSTGDSARAWSMSNAFHLLSIGCRQLFPFGDWAISAHSRDAQVPLNTRGSLLRLALKHFKKQHKPLIDDIDRSLRTYDTLFRPLIRSYELPTENLFLSLAKTIIASRNPYPLRINGKPGTGKTTFLTLLYLALLKLGNEDQTIPVPIYLNLKRYVSPERGKERDWSPRAVADDDLALIRRLLDSSSPEPVIILVDGIDEYVRYDATIEDELLSLVEQSSQAKKVVGIGLNYLANRERFRRKLRRGLDNPETRLHLDGIDLKATAACTALIEAFNVTYPAPVKGNPAEEILRKAAAFGIKRLDLLLLSMLFDSFGNKIRYEHASTLTEFFRIYCEAFLQTDAGNDSLNEAAQLAFDYTVNPSTAGSFDKDVHRRSWKLLHLHSTIRDFLVAWHAVHLVRTAVTGKDDLPLRDLNYVYPHNVNRFCKDIVNSDRDAQFDVIEGAKRIFREGGEHAKPNVAYLVGRVTDPGAKEQARNWLRKVCMVEVEKLQQRDDSELTPSDLLLCRTVYISLAAMNDSGASEKYIQLLIDRAAWNNINRGFHLEYYGDIPFDPERQLSHSDVLDPFPNTFENLHERISRNMSSANYGLLNIEIFTLYSLAQYRHHGGQQLDDNVRQALLALIPDLLKARAVSETVRQYLAMLQINLREPKAFLSGRLAEKLYGLKTELRAGWRDRRLALKRVESVAEHTMGAIILGLTYLPDGNPKNWIGYDKREVLAYVLIHDLAESISGDASTRDPAKIRVAKERERAAFRYLKMSRTYPGIADFETYCQKWETFEATMDHNAKIARDLDRLDNLVQLYLYQREVLIEDFAEWRDELRGLIITDAGKDILTVLQDHFDPATASAEH